MQTLRKLSGNETIFLNSVFRTIENLVGNTEWENANNILKYPLSARGHMIRPFLVYTTAMSLNPDLSEETFDKLINFAAAVELLHNASLIHDDVLDHEVSRRGKGCLYQVFGSTNAILAGNLYYITAFNLTMEHLDNVQSRSFLNAAAEMCYGEILQQEYEGRVKPVDVYLEIIRRKTSALMAMSCGEAARLAGADEDQIAELRYLGELIGNVYQLQDDYKDGDAGTDEEFDFLEYALDYVNKAEAIIYKLPNKEASKAFEQFLLVLRNCLK